MPSPVLNERTLKSAPATWAPPEPPTPTVPPISDGPISTWRPQMMTVNGTISKTAVLFVLLLASATVGLDPDRRARHRRPTTAVSRSTSTTSQPSPGSASSSVSGSPFC